MLSITIPPMTNAPFRATVNAEWKRTFEDGTTVTLHTTTISAGVTGSDHSFSVSKEFWYSPRLGLNMSVKRLDPRHGSQTFSVTGIELEEPDPNYFRVPAGYAIRDMRPAQHAAHAGTPPVVKDSN